MNDWKETLARLGAEMPADTPESVEHGAQQEEKKKNGTVRVSIDRRMRHGKTATLAEGFECSDEEVATIASELKRKLGTGGSSRGSDILIQGDRRQDVAALLKNMGYKIKMC